MNRLAKKEMKEPTNWKTAGLVVCIMYKPELVGKERLIEYLFFFHCKVSIIFRNWMCITLS